MSCVHPSKYLHLRLDPPGVLDLNSGLEALTSCMAIKSIRFEICSKTSDDDSVHMKATPGNQTNVNSEWHQLHGCGTSVYTQTGHAWKMQVLTRTAWHADRVKAGHWLENKEEKAFLNVSTDFKSSMLTNLLNNKQFHVEKYERMMHFSRDMQKQFFRGNAALPFL